MFVKIIKNKRELLYQCFNTEYKEENGKVLIYISSQSGEDIIEEVESVKENRIYFMNDFGRTIDRKCWQ